MLKKEHKKINGLRERMRDTVSIRSHEDMIPYVTQSRHMSCLHAASSLGCLDCVRWMVEHIGLFPNEPDGRYGATPLHYAASAGHVKLVKFLLQRIVKVESDFDGATPLHDAAVHGHITCIQELLKSSLVNPEATDNYGLTAAEWAEQAQEIKSAKLIHDSSKKSATLNKKKKAAARIKAATARNDTVPSFSQYSEGTGSYSSSPISETYAQLEPPDCSCDAHPELPPNLPPRLPESSRPSKSNQPRTKHVPAPKEFCNKPREEHADVDIYDFPPPPDSLLRSLHEVDQGNDLLLLTTTTAKHISKMEETGNSHAHPHTISKPMSAVQPLIQTTASKHITYSKNAYIPVQSTQIEIGFKTHAQSMPNHTPLYSFSTFDNHCSAIRYGESRQNVHNMVPHNRVYLQHGQQEFDSEDLTEEAFNFSLTDRQSMENGVHSHAANYNSHVTSHCTMQSQIPLWKQHLLQQKAKAQQEAILKASEIKDVPDWKKLIQERRNLNQSEDKEQIQIDHSDQPDSDLVPWQRELRKAGRQIHLETN